jgi:hypothetical protein
MLFQTALISWWSTFFQAIETAIYTRGRGFALEANTGRNDQCGARVVASIEDAIYCSV